MPISVVLILPIALGSIVALLRLRRATSIVQRLLVTSLVSAISAAGLFASLGPQIASAAAATVMDGMPSQASADRPSSEQGNPGQTGWADMAGGVAPRPFVVSVTVLYRGAATPLIPGS